jgi:hypothetical protein
MRKRVRPPVQVLERAKTLLRERPKPPPPPVSERDRQALPREKVIAALKKLHPMD